MDAGTNNSVPTVFCQGPELLGPHVSTFLDLAPGYNRAPGVGHVLKPLRRSPCECCLLVFICTMLRISLPQIYAEV